MGHTPEVIESADEFLRLRLSPDHGEQRRAATEAAAVEVWHDVIERYPDMKEWVVRNKNVPLEIFELPRHDPDERVVFEVRQKRSWARAHPEDSERGRLNNIRSAAWKRGQLTKDD